VNNSRSISPRGKKATFDIAAERMRLARRERLFSFLQRQGALVVLIALVVLSAVSFSTFLTTRNIENILVQISFLGLIVVGVTFVIISHGIDLSVGSQLALGGVIAGFCVQWFWPLGLIVPPLVTGAIGLLNGLIITKWKLEPFIVTLASLLSVRGLAFAITNEKTVGISDVPAFTWFGRGDLFGVRIPILICLLAFLIGGIVLTRTTYGKAIFAIGGDEDAARLMGIDVDRTKLIAYTVSGMLAGFAGALLAARLSAGQPVAGPGWELDAIASVVVGGTLLSGGAGSMSGSLIGVLLLGMLRNLINQVGTLSSYWQQVVSGLFLLIVVTAQTYLTAQERRR